MNVVPCYLCGSIGNTRDHFIPRKYLNKFWVNECDLFHGGITLKCCYECNRNKGSKILFPPLSHISWMQAELNRELLYNFYKFCNWVISTYKDPSSYFYEWLEDYKKFNEYGDINTIFNYTRIYIDISTYVEKGDK